jgi:hypothetical protein
MNTQRKQPLARNLLPIADQSPSSELPESARHRFASPDHLACQLAQGQVRTVMAGTSMAEDVFKTAMSEGLRSTEVDRRCAHS